MSLGVCGFRVLVSGSEALFESTLEELEEKGGTPMREVHLENATDTQKQKKEAEWGG